MASILARSAVVLLVLSLASSCGGITDAAEERQCRANMNTLATDQAMFFTANGRWASSLEEMDRAAGRAVPLVCPSCGEPFEMELLDGGYVITCPGGIHGSIDTGSPSWVTTRRSGG